MKKPILDSGSLDASQLGVIGSALLFAYAIVCRGRPHPSPGRERGR